MSQILEVFKDREKYRTEKGPIKWMAPESIRQMMFSFKSDIWAFGATLLEIWTDGNDPYPKMSTKEVLLRILTQEDFHPSISAEIPKDIRNCISKCFAQDPLQRPSAQDLTNMFK
jgi:serine/threonine protein kinase